MGGKSERADLYRVFTGLGEPEVLLEIRRAASAERVSVQGEVSVGQRAAGERCAARLLRADK